MRIEQLYNWMTEEEREEINKQGGLSSEHPTEHVGPEDPLFRAGVARSHGTPSFHMSSLWALARENKPTIEEAARWLVGFIRGVDGPSFKAFRKLDKSRCSSCVWSRVCFPSSRKAICLAFTNKDVPDWNQQLVAASRAWGYRYDLGFCIRSPRSEDAPPEETKIARGTVRQFVSSISRDNPEGLVTLSNKLTLAGAPPPVTLFKVRPRKTESLEEYRERVNGVVDKLTQDILDRHREKYGLNNPQENIFRAFVDSVGQRHVLENQYGGDVMSMMADYWPDMDSEILVDNISNTPTTETVNVKMIHGYLQKRRNEWRERVQSQHTAI